MRNSLWLLVVLAAGAMAQPPAGPPDGGPPSGMPNGPGGPGRLGPRRGGPGGPNGRWWTDPKQVEQLGLSADQRKRIDALFQQSRLKLIDLTAGVEKEEATLEPLLAADQPDEQKVLAQIDKVAHARAELEKANAAMLLGFRRTLSVEQWKKLQSEGSLGPGPRKQDGGGPASGGGRRGGPPPR